MPEIRRSNETCKEAKESPFHSMIARFRESKLGAVLSLISALTVMGCASELKQLKKEGCDNYRASSFKDNKTGRHGFKEIVVYPSGSGEDGYRCVVKPECQSISKDEKKPEPKDCVDWSEPCEKL